MKIRNPFKMKIHNPFKWHVAKVGGKFVVRKRGLLGGWVCMGKDGDYVWSNPVQIVKYCLFSDLDSAVGLCLLLKVGSGARVWP